MENVSKFWPGWNVEEILGSGGFGKVYKASRENFGDIDYSAIKVVSIPFKSIIPVRGISFGLSNNDNPSKYIVSL